MQFSQGDVHAFASGIINDLEEAGLLMTDPHMWAGVVADSLSRMMMNFALVFLLLDRSPTGVDIKRVVPFATETAAWEAAAAWVAALGADQIDVRSTTETDEEYVTRYADELGFQDWLDVVPIVHTVPIASDMDLQKCGEQ